jgi:hypothetical protein
MTTKDQCISKQAIGFNKDNTAYICRIGIKASTGPESDAKQNWLNTPCDANDAIDANDANAKCLFKEKMREDALGTGRR